MKPHSPSRKVGTFIFGSFILASAALIVGILIHRSKPAAAQASASSPAARETTTTPRTRPLSQDEAVAAAERDATANARPCDYTVLTHLDLTRPPSEAELIAAGNLGKRLTPTRNAEPSKFSNPAERKRQESENLELAVSDC